MQAQFEQLLVNERREYHITLTTLTYAQVPGHSGHARSLVHILLVDEKPVCALQVDHRHLWSAALHQVRQQLPTGPTYTHHEQLKTITCSPLSRLPPELRSEGWRLATSHEKNLFRPGDHATG